MRCRDADARRCAHRFQEIIGQRGEVRIEPFHGRCRHAQPRIGKSQDRSYRQGQAPLFQAVSELNNSCDFATAWAKVMA